MEALSSLPGVRLAGENQASLEAASTLLGRYEEARVRDAVAQGAGAAALEGSEPDELLCAVQQYFRSLVSLQAPSSRSADGASAARAPALLGFKELRIN